jgi:hypothetical protein
VEVVEKGDQEKGHEKEGSKKVQPISAPLSTSK